VFQETCKSSKEPSITFLDNQYCSKGNAGKLDCVLEELRAT